jgi:hypothetical protein
MPEPEKPCATCCTDRTKSQQCVTSLPPMIAVATENTRTIAGDDAQHQRSPQVDQHRARHIPEAADSAQTAVIDSMQSRICYVTGGGSTWPGGRRSRQLQTCSKVIILFNSASAGWAHLKSILPLDCDTTCSPQSSHLCSVSVQGSIVRCS